MINVIVRLFVVTLNLLNSRIIYIHEIFYCIVKLSGTANHNLLHFLPEKSKH